jgi:hypothetical protein
MMVICMASGDYYLAVTDYINLEARQCLTQTFLPKGTVTQYTCCAANCMFIKRLSKNRLFPRPYIFLIPSNMNGNQALTPEKLINLPKVGILITSPSGDRAIFTQSIYSDHENKVLLTFDLHLVLRPPYLS